MLWEPLDNNGRGQLTDYALGNGLFTHKGYDEFGLLNEISTKGVQNLAYNFNPITGNLIERSANGQMLNPLTERFEYDTDVLNNRLMSWEVAGLPHYRIDYANNGNIMRKEDVNNFDDSQSKYKYGKSTGFHAVQEIVNPIDDYFQEAKYAQAIEYNGFDKVKRIFQAIPNKDKQPYNNELIFTYGIDQLRKKTNLIVNGVLMQTKLYIGGDFEIEETKMDGNKRYLHYINGGDGLFAIYVKNTRGSDSLYYIHKDHLGSIETITDDRGQVLAKYNYDPWGRKRNPDTWDYEESPYPNIFSRGYTMHEHLDLFGLINMNGRLYDSRLGRMLSPDPYLQNPDNLQNYNRYSYVLNNPLKYTDPSGYIQKPIGWNAGSGGALYVNYHGFRGGGRRGHMEGYNLRHTYSYDSWGIVRNGMGEQVSSREFNLYLNSTGKFNNFVEQNSSLSAYGTSAQNIFVGYQSGLSYYSVKANGNTVLVSAYGKLGKLVISPDGAVGSANSTALVHLGAFYVGSAGGGDGITGIPKHDAITYSLFGTGVWANMVKAGFDAAKSIQPTVSTWVNGSRIFGKSTNILLGASVGYDFATGTANTSTIVNGVVGGIGIGVIAAVGVAATPWVVGAGIVYGVWSVTVGDNWMNTRWDRSYINFVEPRD